MVGHGMARGAPRAMLRAVRRAWRREARRVSRERLRWAIRVRGTVIVLFLALAIGAFAGGVFPSLVPAAVAATAGAIMNGLAAREVARWRHIPSVLAWTGVGDAVLITYVVVATGGTASPFLFLYVVQVLTTALVVDVGLGAVVGIANVALLGAAVLGWAPPAAEGVGAAAGAPSDRLVWLLSLGLTLLFLIFLGGYLTRRLGRSERQLAGTHRRLARSLRRLTDTHAALRAAYERLARAEAQLVETDRMKTLQVLVAGLAHELGNPLTVLAGNVEPLAEAVAAYERMVAACAPLVLATDGAAAVPATDGAGEVQSTDGAAGQSTDDAGVRARAALAAGAAARQEAGLLLANCEEATRRAVGLLGQLRDFGRGGRGTVRRLAPLAPGLAGTLALVRYRLPVGVTVHEAYADVPDVECVPAELNQVFINLLMNAIDALAPGGNLWLGIDRDGDDVRVTVRDDGCGIPPDVRPRVFEPFVTTKQAGLGTGLGLAISRAIVVRHRGRIDVLPGPAGGTVCAVWLPVPSAPEIGGRPDVEAVA